jgi:hypothetical protein
MAGATRWEACAARARARLRSREPADDPAGYSRRDAQANARHLPGHPRGLAHGVACGGWCGPGLWRGPARAGRRGLRPGGAGYAGLWRGLSRGRFLRPCALAAPRARPLARQVAQDPVLAAHRTGSLRPHRSAKVKGPPRRIGWPRQRHRRSRAEMNPQVASCRVSDRGFAGRKGSAPQEGVRLAAPGSGAPSLYFRTYSL